MNNDSLESLKQSLRQFALERDWDQFHSPKNLCCALSVEVGELLENFQWEPESEVLDDAKRLHVANEIGDVLNYLVRLSDKLGIDPVKAAQNKLRLNADKYPVHLARGSKKKYTDF